MEEQIKILLNSEKNVNSVNVDSFRRIELKNKKLDFNEYDVNSFINSSDVFNTERQETEEYRIYGSIEYLSFLNGLKDTYTKLIDLFSKNLLTPKTVLNSFDFYLLKPSTVFKKIGNSNDYIRKFEVVATPTDFEIFNAAFSNNIYDDLIFSYNVSRDINLKNIRDYFNFPLTDLYLFPKYKVSNGEKLKTTIFNELNGTKTLVYDTHQLPYVIGELINGDIITYYKSNFLQEIKTNQNYIIDSIFTGENPPVKISWNYNPFIQIKLQYFNDNIIKANKDNSSYEISTNIPDYATKLYDDKEIYVWRNIIPQGSFDPITGVGVDYPFVNKKRYVFTNIKINILPDTTDINTNLIFKNLIFGTPDNKFFNPIIDINNIGKPCQ